MRGSISVLLLGLVASGCSSGPTHISGGQFQRVYKESKLQTLDQYAYLGETNGAIYMRRTQATLSGGSLKERVFFTETNGLASEFLEEMRRGLRVKQNGAAIDWQTNQTSSTARSRR